MSGIFNIGARRQYLNVGDHGFKFKVSLCLLPICRVECLYFTCVSSLFPVISDAGPWCGVSYVTSNTCV